MEIFQPTWFFTIDFWKIPTCMALLHPACLLIFGNFPAKLIFLLLIFEKFQPAWSYYILHVYRFWEIFQPAWSLHPARLLDSLEYLKLSLRWNTEVWQTDARSHARADRLKFEIVMQNIYSCIYPIFWNRVFRGDWISLLLLTRPIIIPRKIP